VLNFEKAQLRVHKERQRTAERSASPLTAYFNFCLRPLPPAWAQAVKQSIDNAKLGAYDCVRLTILELTPMKFRLFWTLGSQFAAEAEGDQIL
jgi:hypothetical protein